MNPADPLIAILAEANPVPEPGALDAHALAAADAIRMRVLSAPVRRRRRLDASRAARLALAGAAAIVPTVLVLILALGTGGSVHRTATGGLGSLSAQLLGYLEHAPALRDAPIATAPPGAPQTLLVIGSNHRAGTAYNSANTDTMILIRLDASSSTVDVLSLPRDLKVKLPTGTGKLNAAYALGGPGLLTRTLEHQVFPGLVLNHVIDVNFAGFEDLVNAMGCAYADVDRRYYSSAGQTQYEGIDLQPGYQRLCGSAALSFVRFRHTDGDLVRTARQLSFLRWAKDQLDVNTSLAERSALLKAVGEHVQTDPSLHTVAGLRTLLDLAAASAGHPLRRIPFPAVLLPCGGAKPCYVTASAAGKRSALEQLLTPTPGRPAAGGGVMGSASQQPTAPGPNGLIADASDGRAQALELGRLALPGYFPRLIARGSRYCSSTGGGCEEVPGASVYHGSYPRAYEIGGPLGGNFPSYRLTLTVSSTLGEYYGVQGTTWQHPPILAHPAETREVDGRTLDLYLVGAHVSLVAWRAAHGVYWVSNTLTDALTNEQMLAIAASLTRAG